MKQIVATLASRPYAGTADLQAMIALVSARPAGRIADYPSIVDLQEMLGTPDVQENTWLWEDTGGQLLGFAIVRTTYGRLLFEIAPGESRDDVAAQMIGWGTERMQRARRAHGEPVTLEASCRDNDTERVALLKRHGFDAQSTRTLHMACPLNEPIPEPQLPEGFIIRHIAGEGEVEALVELHRAAFDTGNLTVEDRLSWMRTPEYEQELDLVAVAPDGTLAAYAMCSISQEENGLTGRKDGYTDPVATHPAFQRRGLARALLLAGLHLLRQRGVETARLSTWGENIAMQQTAKSVGFRVESTTTFFAKQVSQS
ncbi:MAG: GNAT family N-acetyltransferase [Chloroflexi bacterium]|nr:GNAT family N-acetyltransferase [Chloroflexota bacterium]